MRRSGASIKFKIMAGVGGLVLAFGITVMGNIHHGLAQTLTDELTRRGATICRVLAGPAEEFILTDNQFALYQLFQDTMRSYDDVRYIYVLGLGGGIQAHTFAAGVPRGLARVNPDSGSPTESPRMRRIASEEGPIQDIALTLLGGRLGSVHVGMTERPMRRRLGRAILGWGVSAALMLISGLWVAYWLTSRLSQRLAELVKVAQEVGEGNLEVRAGDESGDEVGRLSCALNKMIADLKRSQSSLMRTGKLAALGELASCVAHEINNPLNTMAVCTQALLDRGKAPALAACPEFEDFPEYLKTVNEEIFRCKGITGGLLDFARHREPRQSAADLTDLVADTLPLVAHLARQGGLEISYAAKEGPVTAIADADQIRQVILNILINALDHTPPGGEIRVWTRREENRALFCVRDSGCGIPPENLQRIFEPFFTTKPSGKGTGLGLAICHKIIENHRGSIDVSSAVGRGSTFTVSIPLENAAASAHV